MSEYHLMLVFIVCSVAAGMFMGFLLGYAEGKHRTRMSILRVFASMRFDEISLNTSTTVYHLLYVKTEMLKKLQEAWKR